MKKIILTSLTLFISLGLYAQEVEVKNSKTGKKIVLLGEDQIKKGKKISEVLKTSKPTTGSSQVVHDYRNGNKSVMLMRNAAPRGFKDNSSISEKSMRCYTENREVSIFDQSAQLLNPTGDVIYPGSVIDGKSVPSGAYTPIPFKKNPIIVQVDGLNFKNPEKSYFEVQNPNSATIKSAVMQMVNRQLAGPQAANLIVSTEEVKSQDDISLALNAHYNGIMVDVNNSFKFEQSTSSYTFLVQFTQIYYSVSIVPPANGADFFVDSLSVKNDWAYVSNVNFGRRGVLAISVYDSEREISDDFKLEINGFVTSGGVNGSVRVKNLMSRSTIKGFYYGGNPNGAAKVLNQGTPQQIIKDFFELIKTGATYSANTPAMPLSYTLRFLNDHSVAMVGQTLKYKQRYCDDIVRYKFTIENIKCLQTADQGNKNNPEDIYGWIKVFVQKGSSANAPITFLNGENNDIFTLKEGSSVALKSGQIHSINASRLFEVNTKANTKAYIKVEGDLDERDGHEEGIFENDPNDKLEGAGTKSISTHQLSEVSETSPYKNKLVFMSGVDKTGKSHVEVNYKIEMVKK